jgi:pimeloyl-ACP methyl ester carboxylesterase
MDDLDEVREALGCDKINLVGYSYGATAAQYYRQHEAHVRTMTLGRLLLDIPVFELWAHNSQRALDLIFDRCQADVRCHAAFPNLQVEFEALLTRLAIAPVTETFTNSSDQQSGSITFTADVFAAVLRAMTKDAKNHSTLPLLIHRAYQDNDWKGFTQFVANGGGPEWWSDQLMEHVIRCSEKWAADPVAVAQFSEAAILRVGRKLPITKLLLQLHTSGETPEGMSPQPGSQLPVLILNGEVDPIDPPENMAGATALWPNSLALVAPYQGHSFSDMNAISCWFSILNEFIQSGSLDGLNTSCMQNIQPPAFVVP